MAASVETQLPAAFPGIVAPPPSNGVSAKAKPAPIAWEGSQYEDESEYVFRLTTEDLAELRVAMEKFVATGLEPGYLTKELFPLPNLGPKLRILSKRIHQAEGFLVLRGMQPWLYTAIENTILWVGMSCYIGNKRGLQCENGPILTHIFDYSDKVDEKAKINNGYLGHANRTSYLPFHSDDGHVISLYCLQAANKIGGRTMLASTHAIYNRLLAQRPDVIEVLKEEWTWDPFVKDKPAFKRALLHEHEGKLICNYRIRPFLGTPGYPRRQSLGPLPEHQAEALEVVARIADEIAVKFEFQTGDVQYIHNLTILHSREEFKHVENDETRRHLLRIVIRDDELAWSVPECLRPTMKMMYDTHTPDQEQFPWSPEPLPYLIGQ